MKFEWIEEGDGRYRVQFFDMDEKKVFDIKITDYSDPYWQQSDLERKIRHECCYDVIFYAGHRKSRSRLTCPHRRRHSHLCPLPRLCPRFSES